VSAVITLTTDFGRRDPWVGVVKGVILRFVRNVQLVDITHDVAPHDVLEAALALEAAVPFFPAGTIHLAVVDPGVGGPRRGLVVETGEHRLVGPDNGIFTPFLLSADWRAHALSAQEFRLAQVSATFHGRDVFAPAAAYLALGVGAARFGAPVTDPVRLGWPGVRPTEGGAEGVVIHVDRFGNLVTSIRATDVTAEIGPNPRDAVVELAGHQLPIVETYLEIPAGRAAGLIGSGGRLEVSTKEASAARTLGVATGAPVVVARRRRN
jgi:S-adenosylmethionine hydrolase